MLKLCFLSMALQNIFFFPQNSWGGIRKQTQLQSSSDHVTSSVRRVAWQAFSSPPLFLEPLQNIFKSQHIVAAVVPWDFESIQCEECMFFIWVDLGTIHMKWTWRGGLIWVLYLWPECERWGPALVEFRFLIKPVGNLYSLNHRSLVFLFLMCMMEVTMFLPFQGLNEQSESWCAGIQQLEVWIPMCALLNTSFWETHSPLGVPFPLNCG